MAGWGLKVGRSTGDGAEFFLIRTLTAQRLACVLSFLFLPPVSSPACVEPAVGQHQQGKVPVLIELIVRRGDR